MRTIRTTLAGGRHVAAVRCIFTYYAADDGHLAALRSYWEFDAMELIEVEGLVVADRAQSGATRTILPSFPPLANRS